MYVYVFGWLSLDVELEVQRGLTMFFNPDIKKNNSDRLSWGKSESQFHNSNKVRYPPPTGPVVWSSSKPL